ncbi:hypothetical protein KGQ20_05030 [Catenulispora sp. NF23]|uniref:Uncharacterized protein n=1 Tax=Catenulispora pinistramenti TaxID=2705254 RepID=A0ABS5KM90_9ACTN|nr:hypothetical protein [Catenulispora pinistramenti]MBS2532129.1 hypothetical protein [Catenulispora pinistramenti]MBS2547171.1 hypothetical protein [Catenulispora pinistramenti]
MSVSARSSLIAAMLVAFLLCALAFVLAPAATHHSAGITRVADTTPAPTASPSPGNTVWE